MRTAVKIAVFGIIVLVVTLFSGQLTAGGPHGGQASAYDWSAVEKVLGVQGETSPDGTFKCSMPRHLTVVLDGVHLAPGSDMTSDFTFMKTDDGAMMVGEIALTEYEVANATAKLSGSNIQETALHNHLLRETPHIMWLHIHGLGDPVTMAGTIRDVVSTLGSSPYKPGPAVPVSQLDMAGLDALIGAKGTAGEGVYAYSIPRSDTIRMNGMALLPEMDISTEISFQPLGNESAAAIGEFVLESGEVEPVLHSLSADGIEVTALHSHMIAEEPRLFYLHCWSKGNASSIARSLHKALALTNCTIKR